VVAVEIRGDCAIQPGVSGHYAVPVTRIWDAREVIYAQT
jgi:hypothetical protein